MPEPEKRKKESNIRYYNEVQEEQELRNVFGEPLTTSQGARKTTLFDENVLLTSE